MHILIFNWKDVKNPTVGGAEIIVHEFAKRLIKDGHTVTWFTRNFPDGKEKEVIDNITIIRRGSMYSVYWYAYLYYHSLKKKPDLVLDMINTIGWMTPLYVPSKKRIAYLNQLAEEAWFFEFPFVLAVIGRIIERIQYFFYTTTPFLCYSESTKSDLIRMGIPEKNIRFFPLGVDHKRYNPGKKKTRYPLFIFVARLVSYKRADLCIDAMKKVVKKFPKTKLAIIGNGPEEEHLRKRISLLKLTRSIDLITQKNFYLENAKEDVKVSLMQKAWVHILPSVKEGWGMVVTETAACGTPSIVTNTSGLKDAVIKDKTGVIISKDPTPNELAKAMITFIQNKHMREDFSKNAIAFAKTLTWDKSYKDFKKGLFQ